MADKFLRLERAPHLVHPGNPICGICKVNTTLDDGSWLCGSCGTTWPADDLEASSEQGCLYEYWAGEPLTGPVCPPELAASAHFYFMDKTPEERDHWVRVMAASDRR
ncbi:hypothetical protein [Leucobacter sp. cx-169]|uniref:hypothetical protein n=1 Tax=Leucobacter sp. cx-169 TaxID=2770549 RepID=UPI00165D906A|nr:hypothetical protein [Leucobacter sp. cx-169]MBC9927267.1 hypothetical protein [Leucobacter sp. cx-169]